MQIVTPELISGKDLLLRLDIDVPIKDGRIEEEFRLIADLDTLKLCLQYASKVTIMGHIGRPGGKRVEELSVAPVARWFQSVLRGFPAKARLDILENLRFEEGEEKMDPSYAQYFYKLGNFYINEAFAAHNPSTSTVLLPKMFPHAAGLCFYQEVETLAKIRDNAGKPLVVIMGGAKIKDKLPVVVAMSERADTVLVGGLLPKEIKEEQLVLPPNVLVGSLNDKGTDITFNTLNSWNEKIKNARTIIWNGPVGYFEEAENSKTQKLAEIILVSSAQVVIGGGDTITALNQYNLLTKFQSLPKERVWISTGGGAMLKLLEKGTLETIEALS